MNDLVAVEGTSTDLTSKENNWFRYFLGCCISLLSGQMTARKARPRAGVGGGPVTDAPVRTICADSAGFHPTHPSLSFPVSGSERTKMLNTQSPHFKRKSSTAKRLKGTGQEKVTGL